MGGGGCVREKGDGVAVSHIDDAKRMEKEKTGVGWVVVEQLSCC